MYVCVCVMLCYVMLCYVVLCCVVLCCVVFCCVVLCCVVLCCVVWCVYVYVHAKVIAMFGFQIEFGMILPIQTAPHWEPKPIRYCTSCGLRGWPYLKIDGIYYIYLDNTKSHRSKWMITRGTPMT